MSLQTGNEANAAKCDLIASVLHAFLLRTHSHTKTLRLGTTGVVRVPVQPQVARTSTSPPLLQPIIDLLQYQLFCEHVKAEVDKMVKALSVAGIPCVVRFNSVVDIGQELLALLNEGTTQRVSGEAVLRIDERYAPARLSCLTIAESKPCRHTLRLTFVSPSSLTAHLSQATLSLFSIPQLIQLLSDEVDRYLLNRICEVGSDISDRVNGTWFVDVVSGRTVGRWEGCVL